MSEQQSQGPNLGQTLFQGMLSGVGLVAPPPLTQEQRITQLESTLRKLTEDRFGSYCVRCFYRTGGLVHAASNQRTLCDYHLECRRADISQYKTAAIITLSVLSVLAIASAIALSS